MFLKTSFLKFELYFFLCAASYLQVEALQSQNWVDPEWQGWKGGCYFPLRDCAIDSATRAAWYNEECSAKNMIIFQINFTAVGVSTLFPDVLWVQPGGDLTRYRYSARLYRTLSSSDSAPVLLYALSDEQLQIV